MNEQLEFIALALLLSRMDNISVTRTQINENQFVLDVDLGHIRRVNRIAKIIDIKFWDECRWATTLKYDEGLDYKYEDTNNIKDFIDHFNDVIDHYSQFGDIGIQMYTPPIPAKHICFKCGHIMKLNENIILPTYPPQYQYICTNCGYITSDFK